MGFVIPGGTAHQQLELAVVADQHGWDGVFVWEGAYGLDPWSLLAAMSQRTDRVKLGTMLTPLPWRRPWKVASQAATIDALSGGRVILGVGLGALDFVAGDDPTGATVRAKLLDDNLEVLRSFWRGDYRVDTPSHRIDLADRAPIFDAAFPTRPKVPVWCVAKWPHPRSMRRILGCDGLIPFADDLSPTVLGEMVGWLRDHGGAGDDFDVVQEGTTPGDDPAAAAAIVEPWAAAGATWWLEAAWQIDGDPETALRKRLEAGPPPLAPA